MTEFQEETHTEIWRCVFAGSDIKDVFYFGTEEDWHQIEGADEETHSDWALGKATIHFILSDEEAVKLHTAADITKSTATPPSQDGGAPETVPESAPESAPESKPETVKQSAVNPAPEPPDTTIGGYLPLVSVNALCMNAGLLGIALSLAAAVVRQRRRRFLPGGLVPQTA